MSEATMKGLTVWIIGSDCTNGGVTSGRQMAVLVGQQVAPCVSTPDEYTPPLVAVEHDPAEGLQGGYLTVLASNHPDAGPLPLTNPRVKRVKIVPATAEGQPILGGMFGGNYITSSDGRFPYAGPVPVFDRFET